MASSVRGVWAIDIGTCSLKAFRLRRADEGIELIGFDLVEHSKILSGSDVSTQEKAEVIAATLRQFLSQNDVGKEPVAISIAGQNSFARFIKLPPVEPKKVPEIVQFEAVQQIPFDINEVEWDWQKMEVTNSPDTEVGIFAIKNELISEIMDHFTRENLRVTCVQISPMALYNYLLYDRDDVGTSDQKATVILDMGAENSTLVICTKDSVWQRSIRIGGNTFTRTIAEAFKLDFEKAEKLKRSAPMSKYMRQIYTAMKPVYTELSGELQRSLGFYGSSGAGRDKGFSHIIALGGAMKLQGLAKYLQQSLSLPVIKPESFEKLHVSPEVSAVKLHENICDFGVVYGLGVQLLDQSKITVNMLPRKIARTMSWNRKARMFTVAAAVLVIISLLSLGRAYRDLAQYNGNESVRRDVQGILSRADAAIGKVQDIESKNQPLAESIQKQFDLFKYRDIVPMFTDQLITCLPNKSNTPDMSALFDAIASNDAQMIRSVPRGQRKQVFVTRVMINYAADLKKSSFPQPGKVNAQTGGTQTPFGAAVVPAFGVQGAGAFGQTAEGAAASQPEETVSGFVVLIEGYSPYTRIMDLLDPPGVAADVAKWGIVTRFENFGKYIKGTPFELYKKSDTTHFKVEWGVVEAVSSTTAASSKQPLGIGVLQEVRRVPVTETPAGGITTPAFGTAGEGAAGEAVRISTEKVLIDTMTGEEMSKVYDIYTERDIAADPSLSEKDIGRIRYEFGKQKFIERDSWFRIQAKFSWKGAPKVEPAANAEGAAGG